MRPKELVFALCAVVVTLFAAMPASPWEFDEPLFLQGLQHYDPAAHHPPPPGYPLFILFGQVVRHVMPSDFATLVAISFLASAVGFVFLALAFRNMSNDLTTGIVGALLFYFSPAMLVHSTLPISEPGALALLAVALYFLTRDKPGLFAIFAALTVGWRLQYAIFVVPLFLVALIQMRGWRDRVQALLSFTFVCLLWLAPLTGALGGLDALFRFETGQGEYLSKHDADVSRSGWSAPRILFRFVGRAWGTPVSAVLILGLATIGAVVIWRRKQKIVIPLAIAAAIYIVFAIFVLDPADGVRYALPFVLVTAYAAAVGLVSITERFGVSAYSVTATAAALSILYVSTILFERRTTIAPPVRAAEFAHTNFPENAVALYELPLWPHAQYFLADRHPIPVEKGLVDYYNKPNVPLFIYADGSSDTPGAQVFRWHDSDAYVKLTRNHYRVASIIPVPPRRRFAPLSGVYQSERVPDGEEWRWISDRAELRLPTQPGKTLHLTLGLSKYALIDENVVTVAVGDQRKTIKVKRGSRSRGDIAIPPGETLVRFTAERAVVPAEVPGSGNRDSRRLAVMLHDLFVD